MKKKNKKILLYSILTIVVLAAIFAAIYNFKSTQQSYMLYDGDVGMLSGIIGTNNNLVEQAAFVTRDEIDLGEEICWNDMFTVSSGSSCINRIEWEFYFDNQIVKTLGKDLSTPKCSGQLTYSECWTPSKVGRWYIVSQYIDVDGGASAETDTHSVFVVNNGQPSCIPHSSKKCVSNNLYWFDSCNVQEELAETCQNGCANGVCIGNPPCTPETKICSDGTTIITKECINGVLTPTTQTCNEKPQPDYLLYIIIGIIVVLIGILVTLIIKKMRR